MEDMARLAVVEQSVKDVDKFDKILHELLRHINLILENPHDNEIRKIKSDILKEIIKCEAFNDYMKYIGFRSEGTEFVYPKELALSNLRMAQAAIERKISFCYGRLNRKMTDKSRHPTKKINLKPANILTTRNHLLLKIEDIFNSVLAYEDEELQELAREQIPLVTLQLLALDRVREQQKKIKTGELKGPDLPFDVALIMELLGWFKYKFFSWVDQPTCDACGGRTIFTKTVNITTERETCRMEVYDCLSCGVGSRFPRYNDVRTLLGTRRGRCGEWANCFALLCRSLGYDTRYVYDTTDHVWCEIWDYDTNTWLHADPCEAKLNAPLLYSHGWGKQLCYVIAVSRDDIQDVTWRYTMDHKEVLKRRTECSEQELISCILSLREHRQRYVSDARRRYLAKRTLEELVTLMVEKKPSDYESHGRISGSEQWRADRGELGRVSHTFQFKTAGEAVIRYYAATDKYKVVQDGQEIQNLTSWSSGVYEATNIFRKVEHDWKQVYLAREEGTSVGSISWHISADTGLHLTGLRLRVVTQLYGTGRVDWTIQYDDKQPVTHNFDSEALKQGVSLEGMCSSLTVRATLSGGAGSVAWQHSQIARQPLHENKPAIEILLNVKQTH